MFDIALLDPSGWSSPLEEVLRGRGAPPRPRLLVVAEPVDGPAFELAPGGLHSRRTDDVDLAQTVDPRERRLGEFAELLETGAGHLAAAASAQREQRRLAAVQARHLAAFARHRPAAALDRPDEDVGAAAAASRAARPAALTEISEWAVDEVMTALELSSVAASKLLAQSVTLVEQLPASTDALERGDLSWAHAVMLTETLPVLADPAARAAVEIGLLTRAEGKTVPQLRDAARRAVLRADADAAARRLAEAVRKRQVRVHPGEDGEGSLSVSGLAIPVLLACRTALAGYAEACATPDDPRTLDQRMADCLVDLILRPDAERPPIGIDLTLVAAVSTLLGGSEPGEVDGHPVPAALVRELAATLGLQPRIETTESDTDAEADSDAEDDPEADAGSDACETEAAEVGTTAGRVTPDEAARPQAAALAELLDPRSVTGTALTHRPTVAVTDEISGQLLALTDAAGLRRGQGLGPPGPTAGYSPSAPLQRFVRARDRRCRFPGCRAAAIRCDLDHNQPWPLGPTSADNLCCLCRHHHRLSHQAPGWSMRRLPDGGLQWTTPGGQVLTTHPQPYGTDDLPPAREGPVPPPPPPPTPTPRPTLRDRVLGRPPTPGERDDDPAPF